MRVLVVDDCPDTLDLFLDLLQRWGHEVRVLSNPAMALPVALEFLPDIAFLDMVMPELDGCEVARRLRRHRVLDSTFLVAVTGQDLARETTHEAGFDVHLLKPVDFKHLELLLKRRLYPAPRRRQPQQTIGV